MDYLNKRVIYEGAVLLIPYNKHKKLFAKLIEPTGEEQSLIDDSNDDTVKIRQRWLIEWIHLENVPLWAALLKWVNGLTSLNPFIREVAWDHSFLAGKRSHRHITYETGLSWDEYEELLKTNNNSNT